jgi:hypothetical protein
MITFNGILMFVFGTPDVRSIFLSYFSFSSALQPADKKKFPYGGLNSGRPVTPPRGAQQKKGKK